MKKGKEMKLNPEAEEFKRGELPGRYTAEENTWERLQNLKNAMEKVEEFKKGRFEEEI